MINKKRKKLENILPLDTPLSIHIFPSYFCNFKCSYCLHSLSKDVLEKRNFKKQRMTFETYKLIIDGLKDFPSKLKTIIFAGHGEPLTHKELPLMIKYAKEAKVSDRVEIVTNASLLTKQFSDDLIDAGLDLLRVSIQGVTDKSYKKTCGVKCSISNIVDNLTYFFNNKKNTIVEIKIVDIALQNSEEHKLYFDLFKSISDSTSIEYLIPFIPEIDHSKLSEDMTKCKHGNKCSESKICSMPFYMLVVEPDGNIVPCCSSVIPVSYGNIYKNRLIDIWNSNKRNKFLCMQLENINSNKVCSECSVPKYGLQKGDYLDKSKDKLLQIYRKDKQ